MEKFSSLRKLYNSGDSFRCLRCQSLLILLWLLKSSSYGLLLLVLHLHANDLLLSFFSLGPGFGLLCCLSQSYVLSMVE